MDEQTLEGARALIEPIGNSAWRELLSAALEPDRLRPDRGYGWLSNALYKSPPTDPASKLVVNGPDAMQVLHVAMTVDFPADTKTRGGAADEILTWFWTLTYPPFVDEVVKSYMQTPRAAKGSALTLLACQHSEPAARAIADIVRAHGFPERTPPRFFREIFATPQFASILLPDLLMHAGEHID